jgi:hypothetical protein
MDRSPRLAELVMHLTGCDPQLALDAVAASTSVDPESVDEALVIVARAVCSLNRLDLTDTVDLRDTNEVRAQ